MPRECLGPALAFLIAASLPSSPGPARLPQLFAGPFVERRSAGCVVHRNPEADPVVPSFSAARKWMQPIQELREKGVTVKEPVVTACRCTFAIRMGMNVFSMV